MSDADPLAEANRPTTRALRRWGAVLLVAGIAAVVVGAVVHSTEANTHRLCRETNAMARRIDVALAHPCHTSPLATIVMVAGAALAAGGLAVWAVATARARRDDTADRPRTDRTRDRPSPPA
jgi:hypothetical protein